MTQAPEHACALLVDGHDRLVLQLRPATARFAADRLGCFGGKCEPGEDARTALPREAVTPPSRVDLAVWSFRRFPADLHDLLLLDRLLERAFAGPHSVKDALKGLATGEMLKRHSREYGYDPLGPSRLVPPAAWPPLAKLLQMCKKL